MTAKRGSTAHSWQDRDGGPEPTREWYDRGDPHHSAVLVKRGRRPLDNPKKAISLRVDADVLDKFKAGGPGWQGRMNEALRKAAGL